MNPPMPPPDFEGLLARVTGAPFDVEHFMEIRAAGREVAPRGRYRHWDKLRHLKPPEGLTAQEWWLGIKLSRQPLLREFDLTDADGEPLLYSTPDQVQELLHYIDQHASGEIVMPEIVVGSDAAKHQYLVNAFIEEAIRSSQLEGATTTRAVAKEMIRSGRPPQDHSERMILNNYTAMEFLHEADTDRLTPELIFDLHRVLTLGTLGNPDAAGRLQTPDEKRVKVWDDQGRVVHEPPPADQLEKRLELLCRFANGEGHAGFMHPVVRSILLHFWLAFDHPFEDGNGRTARGLFYWSMRAQKYWVTEYLSISRIFRDAPSRYGRAFLYTETDEGDTTYFLLYHLAAVKRAIQELFSYLTRKIKEIREVENLLRERKDLHLNHRQLALLGHALRHPGARYDFKRHMRSHGVSFQTARSDLLNLNGQGLFEQSRVGRRYVFAPVLNLADRLSSPNAQLLEAGG